MSATEPPAAAALDTLISDWLTLEEAGAALQVPPNRIRQWASERELIALRTPASRQPRVPAGCIADGVIVKGLGGTLVLLSDSGFDDYEAAEWLFTVDESLPGRPIDALREDRGREVRRRAQALAF